MNIAVFADVHGRVLLSFKLCARWQQETGEKLDLIIQAGDLGAFFAMFRLDKATRRYAERDPSELGFLRHFVDYDKRVADVLAQTDCPLIFVRGNHEDHVWLDKLEQQATGPIFSVDAYQRVWCLKSGVPYSFQKGDERINLLGIGRIGMKEGLNERGEVRQRGATNIQPYEQERIYALDLGKQEQKPDVLLTHDSARDFIFPNSGLSEINDVLAACSPAPAYHFFGHYGGPAQMRVDVNGSTMACKLADLHWARYSHVLEEGSMGILRWQGSERHEFAVLEDGWLKEYTEYSWMHL